MTPPIPGTFDPTTVPPRRLWINRGPHLSPEGYRPVAVFDPGLPPGVAFIRSLGRAGVPVIAFSDRRRDGGRFSFHASGVRSCPSPARSDEFTGWLTDEFQRGSIDLVAPTSDNVSFAVGEALARLGRKSADAGHAPFEAVRTSLFKGRFGQAMAEVGFPMPPSATPLSLAEARAAAAELGYPLMLKPRSHVGIGTMRGAVVRSDDELARGFVPYSINAGNSSALQHVPELPWPILQRYFALGSVDVISLCGCFDEDGKLVALACARKVTQAPRRFGVGTMFEPVPEPSFTSAAIDAVRSVLVTGLFELEVLVDRKSGEHWAIDLNPRGFGQMSLDMARGNDLPRIWYQTVTGIRLPVAAPRTHPPQFWHDAVASYVGFVVRFVRGPQRRRIIEHAVGRAKASKVGAAFEWRDPLPGILFGLAHLRHPRALIRPFVRDVELGPDAFANASVHPEDAEETIIW
jgi:predicted ATP-grasp superfamily ATP-dependent carboligase